MQGYVKVLAAAIATVASLEAAAAETSLTCSDREGAVKRVVFDATKTTVVMDGVKMVDVSASQHEIRFTHDLGVAGRWKVSIDRTTGQMIIGIPGSSMNLAPLQCEKASQKF
ncbi:hypothetical protein ACFQAT_28370 [Undibacterium arcticum]|uniref:C-type lysozyme inhibitor domain-containing protein n=1 Tax=Undibacterium arcticum TaxID=1762892 RepID=A0ABV7FAB5_9BURK